MSVSAASCPVCGSDLEEPAVHLHGVPVHQNLLLPTFEDARREVRGDVVLAACPRCDFVSNVAFDDARMRYGPAYENTQACSPHFSRYLEGVRDELASLVRPGDLVVEVGCGQGDLLTGICARAGARGAGYDASYAGRDGDVQSPVHVRFERRFFLPGDERGRASLVVCRHVLEHVHRPGVLAQTMAEALIEGGVLFVEVPDLGWILESGSLWDLFYEHCSYFSPRSLSALLEGAGLAVSPPVASFGAQYIQVRARRAGPGSTTARDGGDAGARSRSGGAESMASRLRTFGHKLDRQRAALVAAVERLPGPVAVWGAGAKGVTFCNLAGESVAVVVDKNPRKAGRFVPGAAHEVVAPDALRSRDIGSIVVMNPNYFDEIVAEVQSGSLAPRAKLVRVEDLAPEEE